MIRESKEKIDEVLRCAKNVIFGQDEMLESILCAVICEGHLLIEGMPGLGKTLSISTMARLMDLSFKRIQFTPDLLPSDLLGTKIYSQRTEEFNTKFGPIFTQILLADEINRSPAKVQSALLEAMAEKQVTIGEETHKLSRPFVVLATQNPIDQEGTYPLPEAQLDRFMMKVSTGYPSEESEKSILDLKRDPLVDLNAILENQTIQEIQRLVDSIYVDPKIKNFIVQIVQSTRPESKNFPSIYEGAILAGASPRASIWLHKIGKFKAFMAGREFVAPEDILNIVSSVLGHRVILTYEANIDKINSKSLVLDIAKELI